MNKREQLKEMSYPQRQTSAHAVPEQLFKLLDIAWYSPGHFVQCLLMDPWDASPQHLRQIAYLAAWHFLVLRVETCWKQKTHTKKPKGSSLKHLECWWFDDFLAAPTWAPELRHLKNSLRTSIRFDGQRHLSSKIEKTNSAVSMVPCDKSPLGNKKCGAPYFFGPPPCFPFRRHMLWCHRCPLCMGSLPGFSAEYVQQVCSWNTVSTYNWFIPKTTNKLPNCLFSGNDGIWIFDVLKQRLWKRMTVHLASTSPGNCKVETFAGTFAHACARTRRLCIPTPTLLVREQS